MRGILKSVRTAGNRAIRSGKYGRNYWYLQGVKALTWFAVGALALRWYLG